MLAVKRSQYIVDRLHAQQVVLVSELSRSLGVTEETVRRDLEKLEKQGVLRRVHGGAYLAEGYGNETPTSVREQIYRREKAAIAKKCMELVDNKDALMLDCSTTAKYIAQALVESGKKATVITNSLLVANEVSKSAGLRLILLGGEFLPKLNAFFGEVTVASLAEYYADKAFISSAGLSVQAGISDYTQGECAVRRAMIERSGTCCYAGDMTKIGRAAVHTVAPLDRLDTVVTDGHIEAGDKQLFEVLRGQNTRILTG